MRDVWWSDSARRAIGSLNAVDREKLDHIQTFLAHRPDATPESDHIRPARFFGVVGYRFFNNDFPYLIFYTVVDDEVRIGLVVRATVS